MQEKQLLQDPGYVEGVKSTCCMLHGMLQEVKRNKHSHNSLNTVDLRHLSLMSKESKVHSIYNVDSNSKYSN